MDSLPMTLVVLAAGMGSRYGGLKQLDPVGPSGETLLDYSVYDAVRAGFSEIVFIIRKEIEEPFRKMVGDRYAKAFPQLQVKYVFQEISDIPENVQQQHIAAAGVVDNEHIRLHPEFAAGDEAQEVDGAQKLSVHEVLDGSSTGATQHIAAAVELRMQSGKPWGTGHAVLAARHEVKTPFAVINADDYYGSSGYQLLATFLQQATPAHYAMVGYQLKNTLSPFGAVSRGVTESTAEGFLKKITEQTELRASGERVVAKQATGEELFFTGQELVSLNFWAFLPDFFPHLERLFEEFLKDTLQITKASGLEPVFMVAAADERQGVDGAQQRSVYGNTRAASTGATQHVAAAVEHECRFSEFYLPSAVSHLIAEGKVSVKLLPTEDPWFGLTHPSDLPQVKLGLQQRIEAGHYPSPLFNNC